MDIAVCQRFIEEALEHKHTAMQVTDIIGRADRAPLEQLVKQSENNFRASQGGSVDWSSFWAGVCHGITIAACSGEPKFMESIKGFRQTESKGIIQ